MTPPFIKWGLLHILTMSTMSNEAGRYARRYAVFEAMSKEARDE